MEMLRPRRIFPTMPMLAESLRLGGWDCGMVLSDEDQRYRGVRLYHAQQVLQKDVLYLLRPTEREFPFDEYSYLSSERLPGRANHLVCPNHPDEQILDQLLEIFSQLQDWEEEMDLLVYRNASLQELCELGAKLLGNPVCIHDDWFVMMAVSAEFPEIMEPEYLMSSSKGFVPRIVVEDFLDNNEYLETYSHHTAQIWRPAGKQQHSLYVNLWDGAVYKGRLLVGRKNRDFRALDFLLAEALTQRAVQLLRRKTPGEGNTHQNMDDIVFALLQGKQTDNADLNVLLSLLGWKKTDSFLCLRIRPQQAGSGIAEHLLHSDLFRIFSDSYILLGAKEQSVAVNLTRNPIMPDQLRAMLAPLHRDYRLFIGISSPVNGIRELNAAYYQAGAAQDYAFWQRNDQRVVFFAECALSHLLNNLPQPLAAGHLVSPELTLLREHDREKGTQYFETLRVYLLQERDIPRTSETLIIHRTTLQYRLKKIQSLIRTDLEDPWQRMYLMLSLWILEKGNMGSGKPGR